MSRSNAATAMGLKLMGCVLATFLGGCAANPSAVMTTNSRPQTLSSNQLLPAAEIEALYTPQLWNRLRDEDYSAYVIVEANVSGSRLVQRKILDHYPDSSRDRPALDLLEAVELKVSTTGTNIIPRAAAYVVFYEQNITGDLAIIYAKQLGYSVPGEDPDPRGRAKAQFFLARKF